VDGCFFNSYLKQKEVENIRKQTIFTVLIVFLVLAAGGVTVVSAQDDFMDPNSNNNQASVSLMADPPADIPVDIPTDVPVDAPADAPVAANITIGAGVHILDPTQNQTQDQAQSQAQTSINTNNNGLTNTNTNVAVSTSTATNNNRIFNNNTFNPTLVISNENSV